MDLLIKGMGLPNNGHNSFLIVTVDGDVYEKTGNRQEDEKIVSHYELLEGVKAKELPAHHDLKDFGDILRIFDKVIHDVDDDTNALLCDLIAQIQAAPTIVEAST